MELIQSQCPGERNSLFQTIEQTCTVLGKRLLKDYLISSTDINGEIRNRQDKVELIK
ncbi:hypothetical protein [Neorickettsia helminthoeca]|uniref:hypothetical protein n=1 Tax=Neorickettsia helminthoeca TaxID=33994 RepID=UPI001E62FD14|nr:hypothetical protein [Neorickettsia helminthoeca]